MIPWIATAALASLRHMEWYFGPCLLRHHWYILTMVYWARGYFGTPFKGYCGVTQEDPISTIIFNVVVDAVLRHWVTVVASTEESVDPGAADTKGFGRDVQHTAAYFYSDNGIHALTLVGTSTACLHIIDGTLFLCGTLQKYIQDGEHGLSALPRAWGSLCGGLRPQDDGGGEHLPGVNTAAGPLN